MGIIPQNLILWPGKRRQFKRFSFLVPSTSITKKKKMLCRTHIHYETVLLYAINLFTNVNPGSCLITTTNIHNCVDIWVLLVQGNSGRYTTSNTCNSWQFTYIWVAIAESAPFVCLMSSYYIVAHIMLLNSVTHETTKWLTLKIFYCLRTVCKKFL